MKLTIFGANGPVGRLATDLALRAGHQVRAVTRRPDAFPAVGRERLEVVEGDMLVLDDVVRAVEGQDAVLSMVGVPYTFKPVQVYSKGIDNLIAAARKAGVRRIVAVTSIGTNPQRVWSEGLFWNLFLKSFLGRTLYRDMRALEDRLMATDLDWTVVRPAQLVDTESVTDYRVQEGFDADGTTTSRLDLADYLVRQASDAATHRRAVAITISLT